MFVLDVTYTAPADRIDTLLPAHVSWLDEHYAAGVFLASGRKVPRTGGVILAVAGSRDEVEALVATDPFVAEGAAEYRITEFLATKTAPGLDAYRQALPSNA